MRLNSHNEWDALRTVVVGTVEGFRPGIEIDHQDLALLERATTVAQQAFPSWYLDEVAEDLEDLCSLLRTAGATVLRPRWQEQYATYAGPNWAAAGFDIYNVRDLQLVVGDTLIESAPSSRFRIFESMALRELYYEHFWDDGMRWVCAPTPRLGAGYLEAIPHPRTDLEAHEDARHSALSGGAAPTFHRLLDREVTFDAANVIRVGADLLYLVSSTGNDKGAAWLARTVGPDYRVTATRAYRSSHLDSTVLPLRPGLVLLNAARVSPSELPEIFAGWQHLFFDDPAPLPDEEIDHHRSTRLRVWHELAELGVSSHLDQISSPWAGLNVLSVSPDLVFVHDRQTRLIRLLEASGLTVQPVRMRHCYSMLGGLHCTTLDLERDSVLADHR